MITLEQKNNLLENKSNKLELENSDIKNKLASVSSDVDAIKQMLQTKAQK